MGFSKFDGEFGHKLATTPFDQWTWRMVVAAYRFLRKYRKQLASEGSPSDRVAADYVWEPGTELAGIEGGAVTLPDTLADEKVKVRRTA